MGMFRPTGRDTGLQRDARVGDGFMAYPQPIGQAADSPQTIAAATIVAGLYRRTGLSVGRTDTTDTAANILAALPNMDIGDTYTWCIMNHSGQTLTIAGGTGVTLNGATTLATLTSRLIVVEKTGAATVTMHVG